MKRNQPEIEQEFIALIRENERIIYKICTFYISETSPIDDLYQEAVLNLWKAYPKFRNESRRSTWLYRIALNSCISDLRRTTKLRQNVPLDFSAEIAFEPSTLDADIQELYTLIYQLGTLDKALIMLWLEDKTYQEIAEITGLSVANVATKLKRIKEKLKLMSNQ